MKFWSEQSSVAVVDLDKRGRVAQPKHAASSRLDTRTQDDRIDHARLAHWRCAVRARDQVSRYSRTRVVVTIRLQHNQAQCHHIAGRAEKAVRYDVRNGILLNAVEHEAVERGSLQLLGTRFFDEAGKTYLNADFPVFVLKWRERQSINSGWVFDRVI